MKPLRTTFALMVLVLGALASASAHAWHHGGPRVGVYFGPGYWYPPPYYYYPPYYPPVVTVPATPPVYIEQGNARPASPQTQEQSYWYYCADAKAYYPYVKQCPGGWQRVAPQPPSG